MTLLWTRLTNVWQLENDQILVFFSSVFKNTYVEQLQKLVLRKRCVCLTQRTGPVVLHNVYSHNLERKGGELLFCWWTLWVRCWNGAVWSWRNDLEQERERQRQRLTQLKQSGLEKAKMHYFRLLLQVESFQLKLWFLPIIWWQGMCVKRFYKV